MGSSFTQAILFFDGVCNLCNASVDFLLKRPGLKPQIKFASLQSSAAVKTLASRPELLQGQLSTVVWVELDARGHTEIYTQSDAALRVLTSLGGGWRFLSILFWIPRRIRNGVYQLIAQYRYRWFGVRSTCRVPTSDEKARFLE